MDVCVYSRVSTQSQKDQGFSLQEQERALRAYCERKGFNILRHYQDDHSAKDFNRPQFKLFLEDVESKRIRPKYFICIRVDRFGRNVKESLEMISRLKRLGIEVLFVDRNYDKDNPEDFFMLVIDQAMAEVYNTRLSLNTTRGMREAMREGRWMGKAPIGYINVKETKSIVVNPDSAKYVIQAYEMMATGMYYAEEVRRIIREQGFYFTKQKFLNILRNRFYCGIIEIKAWRNETALSLKGVHEPLVSEDLFNKVQYTFNMRKKSRGQSEVRRQEFPLRTLLVCPRCGRFLTGSASKSRTGALHHYYHCQLKYHCAFRVRATVAHGKLEEYFGSFKIQPEVKRLYRKILEKKFESMNSQKDTDLKNIKRELGEFAQRVSSLNEKFIADQIDVDTYSSMKKKFDDETVLLKARETQILNQESDFQIYMKKGITLVDNLKRFYQESPLEIKQKIVSSIFPEKLVFDENSYRTSRVNEAFLLLTQTINELQGQKKENATVSDDVFDYAPPPGLEPGTP